jgi:NADPH:quinone reductase
VRVGDRVAYVAKGPGSYAEARVVAAERVVKLPESIPFDIAAAMMLKGLTVQYLLRRTRTGLEPGDAILWHAAAGGVGLLACQWAKALGYVVIATAGSPEKCELARAHGAAHVIDYRREDVIARVKMVTGGQGVKVVYDSVGKDTWDRSLGSLAPFGLMVSFGNASGPPPAMNVLELTRRGSIYVTRPTLQTHLSQPGAQAEMTRELFDVVERGLVQVSIGQRYRLDDAMLAHRDLEERTTTGSSVLIP